MNKKKLAIFASGSGTNAENILKYTANDDHLEVSIILSNKKEAYVLQRAANYKVPTLVFGKEELEKSEEVLNSLKEQQIDYIILAGFLWKIPESLIRQFPDKIINIHPALLPKYGGKGMYGDRVHQAVIQNGEKESGITIHLVNEVYDDGRIIFQAKCPVNEEDTPESLAQKVHSLEYEHFPHVIHDYILQKEAQN